MTQKMNCIILATTFLLLANFSYAQVSGQSIEEPKIHSYSVDFQIPERTSLHYDESKVPDYTLSDPLVCNDGTRVTTIEQWENKRRAELLEIFASQMYGRTPKEKINVTYETLSENPNFLNQGQRI